jgi:hypothetical protein
MLRLFIGILLLVYKTENASSFISQGGIQVLMPVPGNVQHQNKRKASPPPVRHTTARNLIDGTLAVPIAKVLTEPLKKTPRPILRFSRRQKN